MFCTEISVYVLGQNKDQCQNNFDQVCVYFPLLLIYDNEIWRKGNAKTDFVEIIGI